MIKGSFYTKIKLVAFKKKKAIKKEQSEYRIEGSKKNAP